MWIVDDTKSERAEDIYSSICLEYWPAFKQMEVVTIVRMKAKKKKKIKKNQVYVELRSKQMNEWMRLSVRWAKRKRQTTDVGKMHIKLKK